MCHPAAVLRIHKTYIRQKAPAALFTSPTMSTYKPPVMKVKTMMQVSRPRPYLSAACFIHMDSRPTQLHTSLSQQSRHNLTHKPLTNPAVSRQVAALQLAAACEVAAILRSPAR